MKVNRLTRRGIRLFLSLAAAIPAVAMLPAAASADQCSADKISDTDPGNALFDSGGYEWDVGLGGVFREFATLANGGANSPAGNPPGPVAATDSYDAWGALFVGAGGDTVASNFYTSADNNSCTREDGGREIVFPQITVNGMLVQRKLFVAASGQLGARLLELVTNPGAAPVTTSVQVGDAQIGGGDLGSDDTTDVRSSSSGDALLTTADLWAVTSDHGGGTLNGDPALAHVFDGSGGRQRIDFVTLLDADPGDTADGLAYRWDNVAILPGQTAAFISYEGQQAVAGRDAVTEDANAAALSNALENAPSASVFAAMSEREIGSVRNWKVPQSCYGQPPTIVGSNGNDTLTGTEGPDVILSYGGDDTINGQGGNDLICPGDGNDIVDAGTGNDRVTAENGNDHVAGGNGNDNLSGANGKDKLTGGKGKDTASGGNGNDKLTGGKGKDRLTGGKGKDRLFGGRGNDTLAGGKGKDKLAAGPGNDSCHGGPGHNTFSSC